MSDVRREPPRRIGELDARELADLLADPGLWIDLGAAVVRVRSDSTAFPAQLRIAYSQFPCVVDGAWADVDVRINRASGARRWVRPLVVLHNDGQQPFDPFPAEAPLPLFEWGCNALLAQRLNDLLLLHAGVVERDGLALLLPAIPGSGKSTLTAALALRGWRLLSDEFGALELSSGEFKAMLKPVGLKNRSIQVIREFEPTAVLGPEFPRTRKGTVAHLAPSAHAVAQRSRGAQPGAIVLPRWEEGSPTRWQPLADHNVFSSLAFNAFNYGVLGDDGFRAVVRIVRRCPAWQLVYSDLHDALETIEGAWPQVLERHRGVAA